MGIMRVVFLVVTHADPDSGDLHFAPDCAAAESLPAVNINFQLQCTSLKLFYDRL